VGKRVLEIRRRAKYIVASLTGGHALILHLGMTGGFWLATAAEPRQPHDRLVLQLAGRRELRLRDARREIDGVVASLKARTESMAADAGHQATRLIPTGETGAARAEARAAIDAIGERLRT